MNPFWAWTIGILVGLVIGSIVFWVLVLLLRIFLRWRDARRRAQLVKEQERENRIAEREYYARQAEPEPIPASTFVAPIPPPPPPVVPAKHIYSRAEMIEDTLALNDENITVSQRPDQPQLPVSLKYKKKTYAMLYASDGGILIIARLPQTFADMVMRVHPATKKAVFPKGPYWFSIPIDETFQSKAEIHEILDSARGFIQNPPPPVPHPDTLPPSPPETPATKESESAW